jgi:hypothetical protein
MPTDPGQRSGRRHGGGKPRSTTKAVVELRIPDGPRQISLIGAVALTPHAG